jgi:hypothetical protein
MSPAYQANSEPVSEKHDGGRALRLGRNPEPGTVRVVDTSTGRAVPVTVSGNQVSRTAGYFGRGRDRWRVDYLPSNDNAHEHEGEQA